ncbi:MAG: hypothetical protein H0U52_06885 [Chloroflexi bacterium]|nr:hypothetical protein [Chloroflexota bacterium]
MSSYLQHDIPAPPPARDWSEMLPTDIGLYRNDELGDCAIAATAHLQQVWSSQTRGRIVPSEADVVRAYAAVSGYKLGEPATDRGCDMLSVCNHWRREGIAGNKISAFVKLDHDDWTQLRIALNLFGGLYAGASLPLTARSDTLWDAPHGKPRGDAAIGSWGGHTMAVVGYSRLGVCFVTWGQRRWASWPWWMTYVDECYAAIDEQWVSADDRAPNGVNLAALERDLSAIGDLT